VGVNVGVTVGVNDGEIVIDGVGVEDSAGVGEGEGKIYIGSGQSYNLATGVTQIIP
jgi:ribonuclease PH